MNKPSIGSLFDWLDGAGDAKFLGAIGAFIGAKEVTIVFLFSALIGGLYAIVIILVNRHKFRGLFSFLYQCFMNIIITRQLTHVRINADQSRPKLCYGVSIAVGTGIYMILQFNGIEIFTL